MRKLLLQRAFAILLAVTLVGGGTIQFAFPAYATIPSAPMAAAQTDPCDHMAMTAQQDQPGHSVPCNSMPCKSTLADCLQMCFATSSSLTAIGPSALDVSVPCHRAAAFWPADNPHAVVSIKPDPFPPKL